MFCIFVCILTVFDTLQQNTSHFVFVYFPQTDARSLAFLSTLTRLLKPRAKLRYSFKQQNYSNTLVSGIPEIP